MPSLYQWKNAPRLCKKILHFNMLAEYLSSDINVYVFKSNNFLVVDVFVVRFMDNFCCIWFSLVIQAENNIVIPVFAVVCVQK